MIKINTKDVLCRNQATEAIIASRKCELSPLKVFSISKNEEELQCDTKETPAKDETLLNEANISETPSSSKIGVENLPSKSFKVSPFVSSGDRKLLKSNNSTAKKKPRIVNIQRVRLNSLITLRPNSRLKSPSSVLQKQKRSLTMNEKLVLQLEAKRQRMMAKFREIPRSNSTRGKSLQRRMIFKGKNNTNPLKKSNQSKHNQRAVDQLGGIKIKGNKIKRKKKRLKEEGPDININNINNKNDDVNSEKRVREDGNDVPIRDETLTLEIARHTDNREKSHSKKVGKLSVDDVTNDDQVSSACQDSKSLDAPAAEKKTRNSNVTKDNISSTVEVAGNSRVKCAAIDTAEQYTTENESNRAHNLNVKQSENNGPIIEIDSRASKSDTLKKKEHNRNEGNASKVEFSNYGSKTRNVLKLKVDQVKRDLFSDEENNHETFNSTKISTIREDDAVCNRASTTITNATITNTTSIITTTTSTTTTTTTTTAVAAAVVTATTATIITTTTTTTTTATTTATTATDVAAAAIVITNIDTSTTTKSPTENVDSSSPKNLSRVLQCLQLVPTCKNIYTEEAEYEHDYDRKADFNATTVPNSVEYHFLYDNNAPVKKRRRKYSSRELEFQVNIVLNEESCEECVRVMAATDYEEMINIPPKPRKRLASRKSSSSSPVKKENVCESSKRASVGTCATKTVHTKPLATSSPIDKTLTHKTKKVAVKTCLTTERNNEVQQDNKRRAKVEKCRDIDEDNSSSKIRERKLPEAKESKQVERRPYATDPQALLSNLDLDKFLTSVHGPA